MWMGRGGNTRTFSTRPLFWLTLSLLHISTMHDGAKDEDHDADDDDDGDCDDDDEEVDAVIEDDLWAKGREGRRWSFGAKSKMEWIPLFWNLL